MRVLIFIVLSALLTSCSTPQAVRTLSDQQTANLTTARDLIRAESAALLGLATTRRDAARLVIETNYQQFRANVPENIRSESDPDKFISPLNDLDTARDIRDRRLADLETAFEARVELLERRVEYMEAMLLAQQQLGRAINRDDPLTHLARLVVGDERYTRLEQQLDTLQTAYRENEEDVSELWAQLTDEEQ